LDTNNRHFRHWKIMSCHDLGYQIKTFNLFFIMEFTSWKYLIPSYTYLSVFSPVIPNTINKISFCFQQLRPISLVTVQSARPIVARVTKYSVILIYFRPMAIWNPEYKCTFTNDNSRCDLCTVKMILLRRLHTINCIN
jgi:hypothetical protein